MILDTSAVIAILAGEPEAAELAALIQEAGNVRISAGTLIEASLVCGPVRQQALDDFIAGRIRFTDMAPAVAHALDRAAGRAGFPVSPDSLEAVMAWDAQARRDAAAWSVAA